MLEGGISQGIFKRRGQDSVCTLLQSAWLSCLNFAHD